MRRIAILAAAVAALAGPAAAEGKTTENDLFAAIRGGDVSRVSALLDADRGLALARSPEGFTPLALAAYMGKAELVAAIRARRGEPSLHEACIVGDLAAVKRALAGGADVNAPAPDGFSAIGLAVFFGHPELARALLAAGADVNQTAANAQKVGPIHAALARGDNAMLAWLLENGARPDTPQEGGFRPLHEAAARGNDAAVELLLKAGATPGLRSDAGKTPADLAREAGHAALADRLSRAS